jgi:hypothetical protein
MFTQLVAEAGLIVAAERKLRASKMFVQGGILEFGGHRVKHLQHLCPLNKRKVHLA